MTQRRSKDGPRNRITVSLDDADFKWIQSLKGPSDSYSVARVIKAARLSGLKLSDAESGGVIEELSEWLSKRKKNKLAADLHQLLSEFINR